MKTAHLLLALFIVIAFSCNKSSSGNESVVEYQVTATNYSQLTVAYNNENEQYVSGSYQSGWKYSFKTSKKPFTALIRALSLSTSIGSVNTNCTIKILVNGNVVKTETQTNIGSTDVTAQYVIQ